MECNVFINVIEDAFNAMLLIVLFAEFANRAILSVLMVVVFSVLELVAGSVIQEISVSVWDALMDLNSKIINVLDVLLGALHV